MRRLWCLYLIILLWTTPSFGAVNNCTLTWTARTEADLAGYRVLWGTTSGTYPNSQQLGRVTTTTCTALGITTAGTYYFVVRPFDNAGNVAANSNQIALTLATIPDPPTAPTITSFSPTSGVVGTSVTITGTNFSSTLSSNTVKFNGTTATLSSGNTTQLVASVPIGATTGKITVTVGVNTATSAGDFTITTPPSTTTWDLVSEYSNTQGPTWYYLNEDLTQMSYGHAIYGSMFYQGATTYGAIGAGYIHPSDPTTNPTQANGIIRWVSPVNATISIDGTYRDVDTVTGDGVNFSLVKTGGNVLFSDDVPSGTGVRAYSLTTTVVAGDTIDFTVDPKTEHAWDGTALTADDWEIAPGGLLSILTGTNATGLFVVVYSQPAIPDGVVFLVCQVAGRLAATPTSLAAGHQQESAGSESVTYGIEAWRGQSGLTSGERQQLRRLMPRIPRLIVMAVS